MEDFKIEYKTNFYSPKRVITFSEDELTLSNENRTITKLEKKEIEGFRFGVSWIRGVDFTIGRLFCIDIRDSKNRIIKIRLRSIYSINKKTLSEKFTDIVDKLYEYYFEDIISYQIENILKGETLQIEGFAFSNSGVCWDISKKNIFVKWEDLRLREYTYYFALFSDENHNNYKAQTYLTDWNAAVIFAVSKSILKHKGFYKED
ncbi:MAG: hypothetical protein PHV20_08225 [Bacteroidales bacterium]|nr:hypothetical protein [Bacteroidales bacterium]